jgi:hypothetical protein
LSRRLLEKRCRALRCFNAPDQDAHYVLVLRFEGLVGMDCHHQQIMSRLIA